MKKIINMTGDLALYLSPFSAHRIIIWGQVFQTVEHAYQWKKFSDTAIKEMISDAKSPLIAWKIAQEFKNKKEYVDKSFDKDSVMSELFIAKISQHEDVREILINTKKLEIIKYHDTDMYWGTNQKGEGQNKMGKLWMEIRDTYKN